jgi:hypothetical protein
MQWDPVVLLYVIFLAVILVSNQLKKRRRSPKQKSSAPPDLEQWLGNLWGNKPAERAATPSLQRPKAIEEKPRRPARAIEAFVESEVHKLGRKRPSAAARFTTRDALRRAVVARLVLGPPKGLK